MAYELFRTAIAARLEKYVDAEKISSLMKEIDEVASGYDIRHASTDLILSGDYPSALKAYLASLLIGNKSKGTINDYKQYLSMFFNKIKKSFLDINAMDIRVFLANYEMERSVSKTTLSHLRTVLHSFYQWLADQEIIQKNPVRLVEPIKYQRYKLDPLDMIELEYFRLACTSLRDKAIVDFLFSTGCRVSEACNVKMTDINWNNRSVTIHHGKGDKKRITFFNAECEVSIKNYISSKEIETEYLFTSIKRPYGGLSVKAVERIINKICKNVSVNLHTKVTPHTFRRTLATSMIENGAPIETVKELLGHVSLNTTMQYVRLTSQKIRSDYNKYIS